MGEAVTISLLIPTVSRPTLARTLRSVKDQDWRPGDEVILIGDGPQSVAAELWEAFDLPGRFLQVAGPSKDWGHTPRNVIQAGGPFYARPVGSHLMAIDDDDELEPGAVAIVRDVIEANPGRPIIFRMGDFPEDGRYLWEIPVLREGNIGTPMFVPPNDPGKLGKYAPRYGGDFDFVRDTCKHYPEGPVWRPEIICRIRPRRRPVK